jgi:hypothetical protein
MARPSKYTSKLGLRICERIALGETLTSICEDEGMPDRRTVFRWVVGNDAFCRLYAQAREQCADSLFDEALRVAKDADDGGEKDCVPGSRLYVDTLKWAAAKLRPRSYSDKVQVEQSGEVRVVVTYEDDDADDPAQAH